MPQISTPQIDCHPYLVLEFVSTGKVWTLKNWFFLREKIIELLMKRKSNSLQLNKVKYKILGQIKRQNYREIESKQQRKNL